jgi:hypothetical protein
VAVEAGCGYRGIAWSHDGKQLAYTNSDIEKLFLIDARPGAQPIPIGKGDEPAFSPTASVLAYCRDADTYVRDLDTGQERLLRAGAIAPAWSCDGKQIVVCDRSSDTSSDEPLILDGHDGHLVSRCDKSEGPQPLLSPDSRFLADCVHLSRPKCAPTILCLATGKVVIAPREGDPDLSWSGDSRWLAWGRWMVDPDNNGSYTDLEVWITSPEDERSRKIGRGCTPRFTPDNKHLLYIETANYFEPGTLMAADLHGRKHHRLADRIDNNLAVWVRPR